MGVAFTVRDVPDEVRDELASRAARSGTSFHESMRGKLTDTTPKPTVAEVLARACVGARAAQSGVRSDAASVLAARDADRR